MNLDLEVLVPDGLVVQAQIKSLQATDESGRFGLLPAHQDFLTLLVPCVVIFRDSADREHYVAVDGGVLLLEKNRIAITTREAVAVDHYDEVADAAAKMLKARRLHERAAQGEFAELQSTLLSELRKVDSRK